jgi:PAS domain S-box-containing protein
MVREDEIRSEDTGSARKEAAAEAAHRIIPSQWASSLLPLFWSAVEQTGDHILITDREGRILYVNPAFERATGFTASEVIGKTPAILNSGLHDPEFFFLLWRTIGNGDVFRATFINRKKNGELFHEEKTISPIAAADGTLTHFLSTGRDVTERIHEHERNVALRNRLRIAANEWRTTIDGIEFAILLLNRDGHIRRTNKAASELTGVSVDRVRGHSLASLGGNLWLRCEHLLTLAWNRPPEMGQQHDIVEEPDHTWELSVTVQYDADANDEFAIVIVRDITRLRRLEESLRRTQVMSALGALVAGVAHEIRNPLFAISATLDAFEEDMLSEGGFGQLAARLRAEVNRLSTLMQNLFDYGRPAGDARVAGDLAEASRDAVQSNLAEAGFANVTLEELYGTDTIVMQEHEQLVRALGNVIRNAIQHSPAGSTVTIEMRREDNGGPRPVVWSVRDRGKGFYAGDLARVLDPFFTRRRGGTGLGLSIVQRTVESHGGELEIGNHPGGGALVLVHFPIAESDDPCLIGEMT